MTNEIIEKFIEIDKRKNRSVNIHFKTRKTLTGVFIETADYQELKNKNFWRIVPELRFKEWQNTRDLSLSRLFNGAEFTKLTD